MKKLIVVVLLALLASACGGGSDDAAETASSGGVETTDNETGDDGANDGSDVESDDDSDRGDSDVDNGDDAAANDDEATSGDDGEDEGDEPPLPLNVELVQTRDCAHTATESGGGDGDDAQAEVELPPAVKPEVGAEFLVPVDELITTDLIEGTGPVAVAGADVGMQYVGVLASDGTQFDASWDRGAQPFEFTLGSGQVIVGWDEGIEGMKVGGRRVLQIPSAKAYGDQARGDVIGANSDLVFIVDLIDVGAAAEAAPPIDDSNLGSFGELQIVDLVEGTGCVAEVGDIVTVNYVGVDAEDGAEFDSSWGRGVPFELIVGRSQVIDGWNEGIAGMKVGGERILQIPAGLAYDDGDLVFRVHLEELREAPPAHAIEFDGDAPDEIQVETLVEGDGDEAVPGSIVDANIVVMLYNSGVIVQSTWQQGATTQLALQEGALLPGLEDGILGTRVGEMRQIVLPPEVAYPDGVPEGAGIEEDDAIVFIIEPIRIIGG